jgi:hypothetical protein
VQTTANGNTAAIKKAKSEAHTDATNLSALIQAVQTTANGIKTVARTDANTISAAIENAKNGAHKDATNLANLIQKKTDEAHTKLLEEHGQCAIKAAEREQRVRGLKDDVRTLRNAKGRVDSGVADLETMAAVRKVLPYCGTGRDKPSDAEGKALADLIGPYLPVTRIASPAFFTFMALVWRSCCARVSTPRSTPCSVTSPTSIRRSSSQWCWNRGC